MFHTCYCPECGLESAVSTTEGDIGDKLHFQCVSCDYEFDRTIPEPPDPMADVATPFAANH